MYCQLLLQYINRHDKELLQERVAALSLTERGKLHDVEAQVEDVLRWHLAVLRAFTWHRRR